MYAFSGAREMSEKLQAHAEKLLAAGKRACSPSVATTCDLPLLRSHAKHFGKWRWCTDAHRHLRERLRVRPRHHVLHRANEGLIDPNHSGKIGIRTEFDKDNSFTVDACQVNDRGVDDIIAQVKQIVSDMPVYLTFDIDYLDPAFACRAPVRRQIGAADLDRAIKTGARPGRIEHCRDGCGGSGACL